MDLKKRLGYLMDEFNNVIDKLIKSYNLNGKEIVYYISKKNRIKNKSIFDAYLQIIGKQDDEFREYVDKIKFNEKINTLKFKILEIYNEYKTIFDRIKEYILDNKFEVYKNNTLRMYVIKIKKYNSKILKLIEVGLNSEYNDYYLNKFKFEKYLNINRNLISIMFHIIYQEKSYKHKLNYSKLKKLDLNDLDIGDIILLDEYKKYKSSIARRQIVFWIKSTILHSLLVFSINKKKNEYIIYEAAGGNRQKTYVANLDLEYGVKLIILKPRKKLSSLEIEKLQKEILLNTNIKFSKLKLYGIAFNYVFLSFYKKWFPYLTHGKNLFFGKGTYCSESIAILYSRIKRNISNNQDFAMVNPIDILNSFELDIAGYIEK